MYPEGGDTCIVPVRYTTRQCGEPRNIMEIVGQLMICWLLYQHLILTIGRPHSQQQMGTNRRTVVQFGLCLFCSTFFAGTGGFRVFARGRYYQNATKRIGLLQLAAIAYRWKYPPATNTLLRCTWLSLQRVTEGAIKYTRRSVVAQTIQRKL